MHGRKSNTRVTLKMVAEKAGVTPGCVSLCLNGHPLAERISPETKSSSIPLFSSSIPSPVSALTA